MRIAKVTFLFLLGFLALGSVHGQRPWGGRPNQLSGWRPSRPNRAEFQEACAAELEMCGGEGVSKKEAKECLLAMPAVSDACQPFLDKMAEVRPRLKEACAAELSICGWSPMELEEGEVKAFEADRQSMKEVKDCLLELPVEEVSATCQPLLEKMAAGKRPGRPHKPGNGIRKHLKEMCEVELRACGWVPKEEAEIEAGEEDSEMVTLITDRLAANDKQGMKEVMQCMKTFPLEEASEQCQPVLERLQMFAASKPSRPDGESEVIIDSNGLTGESRFSAVRNRLRNRLFNRRG